MRGRERMFELSGFVYIGSHVTLHVKFNAERVNSSSRSIKYGLTCNPRLINLLYQTCKKQVLHASNIYARDNSSISTMPVSSGK